MAKNKTNQTKTDAHGDLGTFVIRIQHLQNGTCQGRISWLDEDKTLNFRSMWEMMKLIDEAMQSQVPEDDIQTWNK